jgi:hypothetical protein
MRPQEIELWARQVIEQVQSKQPFEDAQVELKADWPPDAKKTARQLAGHANAARGQRIPWIVGVDQQDKVVGASGAELSAWYCQIVSQLGQSAPSPTEVNIVYDDKTVVAICSRVRGTQ